MALVSRVRVGEGGGDVFKRDVHWLTHMVEQRRPIIAETRRVLGGVTVGFVFGRGAFGDGVVGAGLAGERPREARSERAVAGRDALFARLFCVQGPLAGLVDLGI